MSPRSRALLALMAVALLALPTAAAWNRITTYFFADFDQKAGPGQQVPPLMAEQGTIATTGPASFAVVPVSTGGGALQVTSSGQAGADSTLTATFDKPFNGAELQIGFVVTPGISCGSVCVRAMEDTDGEVIDASWGGDGGVYVGGIPVGTWETGSSTACNLTLRDNMAGPDTWVMVMTKPGLPPVTTTGVLVLTKPLTVKALQILVPASAAGTMQFDDLQALSSESGTKK